METVFTWDIPLVDSGVLVATLDTSSTGYREADVTGVVTSDGIYTFILLPTGLDGTDFNSREHANHPHLVVTYTDPPEPDDVPDATTDVVQDVPGDTADAVDPDVAEDTFLSDTTAWNIGPADTVSSDTQPADSGSTDTAPSDVQEDTSQYHVYEPDGGCACPLAS